MSAPLRPVLLVLWISALAQAAKTDVCQLSEAELRPHVAAFLKSLQGVRSLSEKYDADTNLETWKAVGPEATIECAAENEEGGAPFHCEQLTTAGVRSAVDVPQWARRIQELHAVQCVRVNFDFYAASGLPVFEFSAERIHLALLGPDGKWLLTPEVSGVSGTWTQIDLVHTLSENGQERLVEMFITTRGGTRWYVEEHRLFYFRLDGEQVKSDSIPIAYGESFEHNEAFAAPKGHVYRILDVKSQSVNLVTLRLEKENLTQLRRFCSREELRAAKRNQAGESNSICNAGSHLRAVANSVGQWKIENDRFVRVR